MKIETTIQEAVSPRKSGWRIELGRVGETKAVEYLKEAGWNVLQRNWRCGRLGEIDLIARDQEKMLVFCEIKTRFLTGQEFGIHNEGFESVNWKKQRKIVICAMNYMRYFNARERCCRFDVLAIEYRLPKEMTLIRGELESALLQLDSLIPVIRHVQSAFS